MNYEGPYFAEGFLLNLRPCFDNEFTQLGVIPRTKNKFAETVAVVERYLMTNHEKKYQRSSRAEHPFL